MNRTIALTGTILLLISIVLGAFGAHALKELIKEEQLISFETGIRYQMIHGLALLVLGLNASRHSFPLKTIFRLLLIGVLLFSVSIYFLSLQDVLEVKLKFLGPITPLGGLLMIVGWSVYGVQLIRSNSSHEQ
jgi:uncharacterized membrane protein YgdD (TMEM256/DUF423 family)